LEAPPKPIKPVSKKKVYIKIDAQYYSKKGCVILVKAGKDLIYWDMFKGETFLNYLTVISRLTELNYEVLGITSDWHSSLKSAIKYIFGEGVPHQRCLVHTQRMCQSLLTKSPKLEAGRHLLEIVKQLNKIRNAYDKNIWIKWFTHWEHQWKDFLNQRSHGYKDDGKKTWWYTHKNLRKTYRTLVASIKHMFIYLEVDGIEKDTNGLESEFSHLRQKISIHRGLKMPRKRNMIFWYIFLVNERRN
jgi:hypothetical protein